MANYVSVPIPTPGQPVISVRGQSFVSLTLEPDKLMNSPEILQKLDGYFGKAAAKAKIVFLDTERQSALSSRTFILKPAI